MFLFLHIQQGNGCKSSTNLKHFNDRFGFWRLPSCSFCFSASLPLPVSKYEHNQSLWLKPKQLRYTKSFIWNLINQLVVLFELKFATVFNNMLCIDQGPGALRFLSKSDVETQKQMRGSAGKTSQFVSHPVKLIFFICQQWECVISGCDY